MCRKNQLRGCLLLGIGIGLFAGCSIESWLISTFGGIILICLGVMILQKN